MKADTIVKNVDLIFNAKDQSGVAFTSMRKRMEDLLAPPRGQSGIAGGGSTSMGLFSQDSAKRAEIAAAQRSFREIENIDQKARDERAADLREIRAARMNADLTRGGDNGYGRGFENLPENLPPKSISESKDMFDKLKEWAPTQIFMANRINRMVGEIGSAIRTMSQDLQNPDKSTGEIVRHFAEGLPLIGGWVQTGSALRELFTHEAEEIEVIRRGADQINEALRVRLELEKTISRNADERAREEDQFKSRIAGTDKTGLPAEMAKKDAEAEAATNEIRRHGAERSRDALEQINNQINGLREKRNAEVRQQGEAEKSRDFYSSDATDYFGTSATQAAAAAKLAAEHKQNAASMSRQIEGLEKGRDAEQARLNRQTGVEEFQDKVARGAEAAAEARKKNLGEADRYEKEEAGRQLRIASAEAESYESRLELQGKFFDADLAAIRSHGQLRKQELTNQANEEAKRRMRELGESQEQAQQAVAPGLRKDLAAVDQDTAGKLSEKQRQHDEFEKDQAYTHGREMNRVRGSIIEARFREAGDAQDADKVGLAESHQERLDQIKHQAEAEKQAHAENAPDIDKRAAESIGAENEAFGAQAEAQSRARSREFAAQDESAGHETKLLQGVRSSGVSQSPFERSMKVAEESESMAQTQQSNW